jgi:hypothetical protein
MGFGSEFKELAVKGNVIDLEVMAGVRIDINRGRSRTRPKKSIGRCGL